jgi:hypothetical protein
MVLGIMIAMLAVALYLGIDQIFSVGWAGGAANTVADAVTFTGEQASQASFSLASGAVTDEEHPISIPITGLKAFIIVVTGNDLATVTCETNSSSAPDDTFVFPIGGGRLIYDNTMPTVDASSTIPIDVAITTTFWTKSATVDTPNIEIRALYT